MFVPIFCVSSISNASLFLVSAPRVAVSVLYRIRPPATSEASLSGRKFFLTVGQDGHGLCKSMEVRFRNAGKVTAAILPPFTVLQKGEEIL